MEKWQTAEELIDSSGVLAREYASLSLTTLTRDLAELEELGLIVKEKDKYKGNIDIMRGPMPLRKK